MKWIKYRGENWVDHAFGRIGIDARHEASHAVVGRLLGLRFQEATIDRSRVCGLARRIYLNTSFRPASVFALFWDLFPGVTDLEFPAVGPGVMSDPDRRQRLDYWLTTVLAGYETEKQMGLHGGDLDFDKARRAATECLAGDTDLGRAYVENLSRTVRMILNESRVSLAIDHVAVALFERRTLTMEEVDRILAAMSARWLAELPAPKPLSHPSFMPRY